MTYVPRHFTLDEFACKCGRPECDAPPPTDDLLRLLDLMREFLGRPVVIKSGSRCAEHNRNEGGRPRSRHLAGKAADILVSSSAERFAVVDAAFACGVVRIGIANSFVHVDTDKPPTGGFLWLYS